MKKYCTESLSSPPSRFDVFFIITSIIYLLCFQGCNPEVPRFYEIKSVRLQSIKSDTLKVNIHAFLTSQTKIDYEINDLRLKIYKDSILLGESNFAGLEEVKYSNNLIIYMDLNLLTNKLLTVLNTDEDSLHLTLKGFTKITYGLFKIHRELNIPVNFNFRDLIKTFLGNYTGKNSILTLNDLSIRDLKLTTTTFNIGFEAFNPFNIDFVIMDYPSTIYLNNTKIGFGQLEKPLILNSQKNTTGSYFIFKVDNLSFVSNFHNLIFQNNPYYETKGILHLKIFNYLIKLPFNFKGTLTF